MSSWIWLYVILNRGSGSDVMHRTPHPTYASCFAALKQLRTDAPHGNENEVAIVAYCGQGGESKWSDGKWRAIETEKAGK